MRLHSEGYRIILSVFIVSALLAALFHWLLSGFPIIAILLYCGLALLNIWTISFFRVPKRTMLTNDELILSSADGKVVAIEEVEETEYFNDTRIQVSVFMSPLNVHVNWYPIMGKVLYAKYHPGKFLVAFHPKSSTENERTTIVVGHANGKAVLIRQIAGFMARRIIFYSKEGQQARQCDEFGIIRFGSRVDFLLPTDVEILVRIGDKVTGSQTPIARFNKIR